MDKEIKIITKEDGKKAVVIETAATREEVDSKKEILSSRIYTLQQQADGITTEIAKLQAELDTYSTYATELEKVEPTDVPVEAPMEAVISE